ncbi:MAG: glycosyltransferase family 1 protein, partial [Desulfobacterales bacterium]|nr:glycosyltransferase family 1 protein [Desulfobacterales bacterium]
SLSRARLLNIFQTIGSAGSVYTLLAPYFMAYRLFSRDRRFAENCHTHITGRTPQRKTETCRVALFTDTYSETNGVALTLRMQLAAARKNGKELSIFTCYPDTPEGGPVNFRPVGFYKLPEYPEVKLYYPPFLKILDYCFRNRPNQIQASTPGPMGLCALAVARTLDIPVYGTYHTAFPQYAAELTGDNDIGQVMWKAMAWFYNQMNLVYVPSAATGKELVERGVDEAKIRVYPRGVDTERFHPERRNGIWSSGYGLSGNSMKLLYVGRLSREKNLDVLARAFRQLSEAGRDMDLIVVGDGPYKQEMAAMLKGTRTLFTGVLTGRRLAEAYASSDLFVFPSTTDTFGNVVLEAQASGLPVIVTDRGGPRENLIAGKTGCIVPSLDAAAIAREISRLSEDPAGLSRMKKAARRYMRSRSFEENFLRSWELAQRAAESTESPGLTETVWPLAS